MGAKQTERAKAIYLVNPISRRILAAIGNATLTLREIVDNTQLPAEEVAVWLLDLKRKRLVAHSIEDPHSLAEARFSLTPKVRELLDDLRKDLVY